MARVLPDLSEAELIELASESPGEAQVYRSCRLLPDEWVVLHSVRSMILEPGEGPRDREGDFIVLHPSYGMLVIEVKSGEVFFRDNRWYRKLPETNKLIKDPFEQALKFKHSLLKRLKSDLRFESLSNQQILCRHAVLLPDVRSANSVRLPHIEPEIIGAAPQVGKLKDWIEGAYRFGESMQTWQALGTRGLEVLLNILAAPFTTESLLGFRIGQESRKQLQLTHEQWCAHRRLRVDNELAIAGAAGTGKTLLSLRRAQDCAKAGLRTLLLCYNRPLAEFLKHESYRFIADGEIAEGHLVTNTFEAFCKWVVKEHASLMSAEDFFARAQRDRPMEDESLVQWPQAMALALEACPLRYDVVIVDEAQDFGDAYWFALDDIWQNASKRYVFYDPNQSIFRRAKTFPVSAEKTLMLRKNCRNTRTIHEASYRFYQGPPDVESPPIPGLEMMRWEETNVRDQATRLVREITRFIDKEQVEAERIAVLVLSSTGKAIAYEAAKRAFKGGPPLAIQTHGKRGHVLLETVMRFKGLEASVVVIWAHELPKSDKFRELRYVGFSRAQSILVTLGTTAVLDTLFGS